MTPELRILEDAEALARAAEEEFARRASGAVERGGVFSVALAGGSTPRRLYERLAGRACEPAIPWERVHLFWGDERHVPPDHPDSNYRMVREALLSRVALPAGNVHRIRAEEPDAERAAKASERELRAFFDGAGLPSSPPRFDLVLLGMGEDGHTASLFPGTAVLSETNRLVAACRVGKPGAWRITMTPAVLNAAACVVFLVAGAGKAAALREVLEGERRPELYPSQLIRPVRGDLIWLVEVSAARLLRNRSHPA